MFERPLPEVRRALQEMEKDITWDFSTKHPHSVSTNYAVEQGYVFHIRDPRNSSPWFASVTIEATEEEHQRTRVVVEQTGRERRKAREAERWWLEVLTVKLEKDR